MRQARALTMEIKKRKEGFRYHLKGMRQRSERMESDFTNSTLPS